MTAAGAIDALGPVDHWLFGETTTGPTVATVIPNLYISNTALDEEHWFEADAASVISSGYDGPCGGDYAAYVNRMRRDTHDEPGGDYGGCADFRAPKGAYSWDGTDPAGPDPGEVETPERVPLVEPSISLFGSQPFSIVWLGGNFQSRRLMWGVGDTVHGEDQDGTSAPFAATLWFGSPTANAGFPEGTNGTWVGIGAPNTLGTTTLLVQCGFGNAVLGYGSCTKVNWPLYNAKGIHAVVYDPSKPVAQRLMMWSDGAFSYVGATGDEDALGALYTSLGSQYSKLLISTGWDPYGVERYTLDDPPEEETVRPWHQSYNGVIHNLAVFDYALSLPDLAGLFFDANNRECLDEGCSSWFGTGPTAVIGRSGGTDNLYTFTAEDSLPAPSGGTIVAWEWKVVNPNPYGGDDGVPAYDEVFSTTETTDPVHLLQSNVYGNAVTIQLTITDSYCLTSTTTHTFVPNPEGGGDEPAQRWHLGRLRWFVPA